MQTQNEMTQTHFIERQRLYFEFTSEQKAKEWNMKTTTFCREEILPVLEKLFDKYVPSDRWYSVQSLEIDLGNIYSRDLKDILLKKIEASLISLLEKKEAFKLLSDNVHDAAPSTKDFQVKSHDQKLLEIFYSFLEHGVLPWNSQIDTTESLEQEIVRTVGVGGLAAVPEFRERIKLQIVRERLFYQFTKSFRDKIFRRVFFNEVKVLVGFRDFILKNLERSSLDRQAMKKIKLVVSSDVTSWIISERSNQQETWPEAIIFSLFAKMAEIQHPQDQILEFIKGLTYFHDSEEKFGLETAIIKSIKRYAIGFIASRDLSKPGLKSTKISGKDVRPFQNQKMESDVGALQGRSADDDSSSDPVKSKDVGRSKEPDKSRLIKISELSPTATQKSSIPFSENKQPNNLAQNTEASKPKDEQISNELIPRQSDVAISQYHLKKPTKDSIEPLTTDFPHEYFILNAGIILCWPYLTKLFKRAGYLADNHFKDIRRQERAVHLLGYLAGFEECDEHQLTIAKLLTNWPLSKPIIKRLKFTSKEKKLANDMLANLILNWPILKNTSAEGLQTSFFQREGKLKRGEQGWKLIVEQKGYDMLLDHLAYSIAIIKLPWMEEVLRVDWA